VEAEEKLLQRCLQILAEYDHAVTILTKSSLILRDLDILKQINRKNGMLLLMSLTTLDEELRKLFEPGASSIQERLDTLQEFHRSGIATGLLAMPFLPYISDSAESMDTLFQTTQKLGIDFILPGFLTLRPGIQKQTFLEVLKQYFPHLENSYLQLYSNNLRSGNPQKKYRDQLLKQAAELIEQQELPRQIPHYVYQDRLTLPDEIYVLLEHLKFLYSQKKVDVSRLNKSSENYHYWLLEQRKYFSHRRNLPANYLSNKMRQMFESGKMAEIIDNQKLYDFLADIVIERKIFNYQKLQFD
jgi:hypothetical protein